jgi:hypothetical protein
MNVFSLPRPLTCAAVIAAALACSCSTKYEPQLTLPPATFDRAIDAIVELHPLQAAEGLRSGHTTYGVLAEDYVNRPPTRMSQAITAQVLNELSSSGLFRRITLYDPQPDLVLTGRIEQFYEHDRRKVWTYVPFYSDKLAGLFRLNTHMSTGEVKLTMMLLKPTGKLVGTYQGRAKFDEDFTPNSEVKPGGRLNRAFSEALAQIRDEMLADGNLPKSLKTEPMVRANRPTNPAD